VAGATSIKCIIQEYIITMHRYGQLYRQIRVIKQYIIYNVVVPDRHEQHRWNNKCVGGGKNLLEKHQKFRLTCAKNRVLRSAQIITTTRKLQRRQSCTSTTNSTTDTAATTAGTTTVLRQCDYNTTNGY